MKKEMFEQMKAQLVVNQNMIDENKTSFKERVILIYNWTVWNKNQPNLNVFVFSCKKLNRKRPTRRRK